MTGAQQMYIMMAAFVFASAQAIQVSDNTLNKGPPRIAAEYESEVVPHNNPLCQQYVFRGQLAREYGEMLSQMQGKRVAFAGDSLMDMVIFPLLCSAQALGWSVTDEPVSKLGTRWDDADSFLAKRFDKPGMEPIVVAHMRFWNFLFGEKSVKVDDPFRIPLMPPIFDALFLNAAHAGLDWPEADVWRLSVRLLLQSEREATHLGRVVFLGHPPQHFDTPTGQYEGPQPEGVPCVCRHDDALQQQQAFKNNAVLEAVIAGVAKGIQYEAFCHTDRKLCKEYYKALPNISKYANPWHHYKDSCMKHMKKAMGNGTVYKSVDCTHFPYDDYELHAPFLKKMLGIAGL